jgi:hypothetical protein
MIRERLELSLGPFFLHLIQHLVDYRLNLQVVLTIQQPTVLSYLWLLIPPQPHVQPLLNTITRISVPLHLRLQPSNQHEHFLLFYEVV